MARARNIKPSIMANEDLADLDPLARLLFIYLWMLADREGRLEDRPKRIAAQALAYDRSANVDEMLTCLEKSGFIKRYITDGLPCIQIVTFLKHQTPHVRESASTLPCYVQSTTKAVPRHNLGGAVTWPRSPDSLIPDSLIPDSLIPDSLIPDSRILTPETKASPSAEREAENCAKPKEKTARGTRLSPDWIPSEMNIAHCRAKRPDLDPVQVAENFRDYWIAKPGTAATKLDWDAAWRTWVRNERAPPRQTLHDQRKATLDELTGRTRNGIPQPTEPRDITGESWLVA